MTFEELKSYFKDADLPKTLDSNDIFYRDVKHTVDLYIFQIEEEIRKKGIESIKDSYMAKAAKRNLMKIYEDLKVKSNWNAKIPVRKSRYSIYR